VFAAARSPSGSEGLAQLLQQYPEQLSLLPLDVRSDEQLEAAVAAVREQAGALDVLINNAGVTQRGVQLGSYDRAAMLDVLHQNSVAPILIGQAFLPLLRGGSSPKVVNVSSQLGAFSVNKDGYSPIYSASKSALNMLTLAFAHQASGIITIAVHPGWVRTDMGGDSAPLGKAESVGQLRALIARLTPEDNAKFFNYDGAPHAY
jgi:NAD(P)-dependent dehydrogenase (short-subunit alcohol dehydrogenase family)